MNNLEEVKEEIRKEFQQVSKLMMEKLEKVLSSLVASETEVPKEKVWKPKNRETFYYIAHDVEDGGIAGDTWINHVEDYNRYNMGNCFKTKAEAKAMLDKLMVYTQLKRLAEEINTEPINWNNKKQPKYFIACDYGEKSLCRDWNQSIKRQGIIYSTNPDFLVIAKERIGEENLLKLFEE